MPDTFPCPACGAPNEPEAGAAQMTCSYCGANLSIPAALRRDAPPKAEQTPAPRQEVDASEFLRQAQPVVVKAWNAFAGWTWIRRALPACLVIVLVGLCACGLLALLPYFTRR